MTATAAPRQARSAWSSLANFVALNLGWFACVLGAADGNGWQGPIAVAALLALHLALFTAPGTRGRELLMIAVLTLMGCAMEWGYTAAGVLVHRDGLPGIFGLPYWIVALWALFATAFDSSLAWLRAKPWLAAGLSLVGCPMSYFSGSRLGALEIGGETWVSLAILGVAWAAFVPAGLWVAGAIKRG